MVTGTLCRNRILASRLKLIAADMFIQEVSITQDKVMSENKIIIDFTNYINHFIWHWYLTIFLNWIKNKYADYNLYWYQYGFKMLGKPNF